MKPSGIKALMSKLVRTEMFEGEEHFVLPAIYINEGVHNGVLYTSEELAKFPSSWNGRVVPVWHAYDATGNAVTANSPDKIENQVVGITFNTVFEDGKLKGEVWINKKKCEEKSPRLLEMIVNGEPIELSTGLYSDDKQEAGEWNGEPYTAIAVNIRSDHLAVLPDGEGACSWKDGGGMPRINQKGSMKIKVNELTLDQRREFARAALLKRLAPMSNSSSPYVMAMYADRLVYELSGSDGNGNWFAKLYQVSYSVTDTDVIISDTAPIEVRLIVEPVPVITTNAHKNKDIMNKKQLIEKLIANGAASDKDAVALEALTEDTLNSMLVNAEKAKTPPPAPKQELPVPRTVEEFITNAPKEIQEVLRSGLSKRNKDRADMINGIKANQANTFSDDELSGLSDAALEKLHALARQPDHTLAAGGAAPRVLAADNGVPAMPALFEVK